MKNVYVTVQKPLRSIQKYRLCDVNSQMSIKLFFPPCVSPNKVTAEPHQISLFSYICLTGGGATDKMAKQGEQFQVGLQQSFSFFLINLANEQMQMIIISAAARNISNSERVLQQFNVTHCQTYN